MGFDGDIMGMGHTTNRNDELWQFILPHKDESDLTNEMRYETNPVGTQ